MNPAIDTLHALRDNWAAGGDMGRPDGFVAVREGGAEDGEAFAEAYAVKIELWTDDCLMDLKKQDEAAARRRGEALAKKWAKEHWPHTGYVDLGGAEGVYGATWAWDKATENELERTDPDEVVRLPAARANPDVTSTPAFRRWFGDSKVVDVAGEPRVVYHGAPDVRGIFAGGFKRSSMRGDVFFATDDPRTAETYTDPHRAWDYQNAEPGVIPLYLRIENPLVVDAGFQHWRGTEHVIEQARQAGHDGVIIENTIDHYASDRKAKPRREDACTVFAFFSPTQVKSALTGPMKARDPNRWHVSTSQPLDFTGPNDGTFDLDDANLRSNPAALRKKDFLALLAVPENRKAVEKFVDVVRAYQSDSAGYKSALANRYLALPASVQDAISEPKANLKKLYRGDDGKSRARATSWTSSLDYAKLFGQYVFPYAALASHGGTINTHKLVRLLDFAFEDHDVGDDEDEVVILEPVWKSADSDDGYLVKNVKGYWFPRENPADAAARLGPVVDTEEWEDGTVVEFVAVPFPVERKPLSYKDDPEVSGFVRVEDLIATQRRVTKAGVEKYLDDIAGRVGRAGNAGRAEKIRVYETHDGRRYIADGHHRAVAAWAAGVEVLPAVIQLVRE